jgi:hypothetical protein
MAGRVVVIARHARLLRRIFRLPDLGQVPHAGSPIGAQLCGDRVSTHVGVMPGCCPRPIVTTW